MDNLLNSIEKIKELLTSDQYTQIMNDLSVVNTLVKPQTKIEVIYEKLAIYDSEFSTTVGPTMDMAVLYQEEFDWEPHVCKSTWTCDFGQIHMYRFMALLTKDNRQMFSRLCDDSILSEQEDQERYVNISNENRMVFVRITKPTVEGSDDEECESCEE